MACRTNDDGTESPSSSSGILLAIPPLDPFLRALIIVGSWREM
jgi:hypothetical protein